MGEIEYNEGITEAVLDRQERLDPEALRLLTYGRPDDVRLIDGQDFPSGRLGNMSGGFHFTLFDQRWYSSEHLYLCGEWSLDTDKSIEVQEFIRRMRSGAWAWRYSKAKYKNDIRSDFPSFRHQWMLWCVWQKCRLNERYANLLKSVPDDVVIVELVKKNDLVWATNLDETGILYGGNAMGKILTICRRHLIAGSAPNIDTDLLNAANIYILGQKIKF